MRLNQPSLVIFTYCVTLSFNIRHKAIREALDIVDADSTIDLDEFNTDHDRGDLYIDSITIFHSGYGAEWGVSLKIRYHTPLLLKSRL